MTILGIETSCDETAAGIVTAEKNEKTVTLLTNVVSSSLSLHAKTGGIIPEIAAREQIKYVLPVIAQALDEGLSVRTITRHIPPIDAIAVTYGPGLIGSLLVGIETAKTLAYLWDKPLIPVNHMMGHIYANFIRENRHDKNQMTKQVSEHYPLHADIQFPAIVLVISGGHTDLLFLKRHGDLRLLGGTRDDAAGEAFDKIGRILGLPYPGGPAIEMAAKKGNPDFIRFPRPLLHSNDFEFSFSGLKTAAFREVQKQSRLDDELVNNLAASVQHAINDVLVTKTITAAKQYTAKSILLSGGVAANQTLRNAFENEITKQELVTQLFAPPKELCTDNGAMIASAAFFNHKEVPWQEVTADPELYF